MSHINPEEVGRFSQQANRWWDEQGPLKGLHELNPSRLQFIKHHLCHHFDRGESDPKPFVGLSFCDVGCGGGILTEPLARLGATMTGVDASPEAIEVAKEHASQSGLSIDYQVCDTGDLQSLGKTFDAVLSLEVVEHVDNLQDFLSQCSELIRIEGALILSTLNKTLKSWALGIVVAENVLKWAPKGAHDWNKFVSPEELGGRLRDVGINPIAVEGVTFCPFRGWHLSSNVDINYLLYGTK